MIVVFELMTHGCEHDVRRAFDLEESDANSRLRAGIRVRRATRVRRGRPTAGQSLLKRIQDSHIIDALSVGKVFGP